MNSRSWASRKRRHVPHAALHVSGVGHGLCAVRARRSGVSRNDPRMVKAADWMLKKQVTHNRRLGGEEPEGAPGGLVLRVQQRVLSRRRRQRAGVAGAEPASNTRNESYQDESVQRAIDWILSMQCKNGGWASFDKDNDRMVFQHIPFADHNAMLDPATVDITGRVLECWPLTATDERCSRCSARWSSSSASKNPMAPGLAAGA